MAFGITPSCSVEIPIEPMTVEQYLVIAVETVKLLDWTISYTDEKGFTANATEPNFSSSEEITIEIIDNIALLKSESIGNQIDQFEYGKNNVNIEKFITKFEETKPGISSEDIDSLYNQLKLNFTPAHEDDSTTDQITRNEKLKAKSLLEMLVPVKGYFITPILIDINILIFILMALSGVDIFSPTTKSIIEWGANCQSTMYGEEWRLITHFFIHIGIIHLLSNMIALFYIGSILEPFIGTTKFLGVYIVSGIFAGITSYCCHSHLAGAGASGAIFGLFGTFLTLLWTKYFGKSIDTVTAVYIGFFVFYNLISGLTNEGIDNAAHIGGLICGMLLGYLYHLSIKSKETENVINEN